MTGKLILLPALGATRLLFEAQRHVLSERLFLPDWPAPLETVVDGGRAVPESLRDYARRWADRFLQTVLSSDEAKRGCWIGGVASGGALALEAARKLVEEGAPPRGVFLIASARASSAMPGTLRWQAMALRLANDNVARMLMMRLYERVARREGLSELDARLLVRMVEGVDLRHLRWGVRAAAEWSFGEKELRELTGAGVAIHQIHGDADWTFRLVRGHADRVIRGGKHLINMTHAEEVNAYLEARMAGDVAVEDG
ncbi:MAG: hypothetical protein SFZ24_12565 [Planctomycetota bacterium]|nr:hypothetical protein [Planctomycetota bacterium]